MTPRNDPTARLLAASASLAERLAGGHLADGSPAAADFAESLLGRWRERAARGDPEAFARRLAWEGWDLATARCCLAPGRLAAGPAAPPPWIETFREIGELAAARPGGESWRSPEEPLPFEDLFVAHVAVGRRRLAAELVAAGVAPGSLASEAWRDLERGLARRLTDLAGRALLAGFDACRGGPPEAFRVRLAEIGIRRETGRYHAFVEGLLTGGLLSFAERWPVLARLTSTAVDLWVRNTVEMLARWRADGPRIRDLLAGEPALAGPVLRVRTGLSDPHDGGRTVHALRFGEGELIYKARGLGLDVDFARLLAWCGERGLSLDLQSPRVLDRGTHGWSELVAAEPCGDEEAARRFHRRAGMLLALLHACGAHDCHFENLVARGEHPLMIDLEAWLPVRFAKWLASGGLGDAWYQAALRLERSVLSTGLLPRWQEGPRRGELRNVGGLGGGRPGPRRGPVWRNLNADPMVLVWGEVEAPAGPNVPTLAGRPLEPAAYTEEIVAGFSEMYALLLQNREDLLSPVGPLRDAAGRKARFILRSTASYRGLLEHSLSAAGCRDGAARDVELEALARIYLDAGERPAAWPLLAAERQALAAGDVPLFQVPVEGIRIELPGGGAVDGALTGSSLTALRENLEALDPSDLRSQTGLIRAALAAGPQLGGDPPGDPAEAPAAAPFPGRDRLLEAALAIGERLRRGAIASPDGSVAWIGPRYLAAGDLYELAVLGSDLYGGTAGIALFLAALHRRTGDEGARELALRAIAPLRRRLAPRRAADRPELGIGGLTGLPSVLYAFVWVGELLGEPDLAREAHALSVLLDPARLAADEDFDVISGGAGAILGLLALDRVSADRNADGRSPLELASLCADHLVARRVPSAGGLHGWAARGRPPLAGFSHGAAGICLALLRLYARTRAPELLAAARDGIAGERHLYAPPQENWRDPRRPQAPPRATWCHGAPGIALARIGALDVLDSAEIRHEIGAAIATTRAEPLTRIDHLCCGNLGRAEILLQASQALGDPSLRKEAESIAGAVLHRAGVAGHFGCAPHAGPDLTDPSFFRGEAGIGFSLLRLAGPGGLPCPLLLESPAGTRPAGFPASGSSEAPNPENRW